MITITKTFEFEAAHYLPNHEGHCKNMHGHSYRLEVEIRGPIIQGTGMIMDFGELKKIVRDRILCVVDHSMLNESLPFLPTAENMVGYFAEVLSDYKVQRVRLWETSTSYAEWRRS